MFVILFATDDLTPFYSLSFATTALCMIPYHFVPEKSCDDSPSTAVDAVGPWSKIQKIVNDPRESDYVKVLISRAFYYFGGEAFFGFLLCYIRDQIKISDIGAQTNWVSFAFVLKMVIGLITVIPLGWVSDKYGFGFRKVMVQEKLDGQTTSRTKCSVQVESK